MSWLRKAAAPFGLMNATNPDNLTNFFKVNPDSHAYIEKAFRKVQILLPDDTLTSGMDDYVKSLTIASSMSAMSELVRLV